LRHWHNCSGHAFRNYARNDGGELINPAKDIVDAGGYAGGRLAGVQEAALGLCSAGPISAPPFAGDDDVMRQLFDLLEHGVGIVTWADGLARYS